MTLQLDRVSKSYDGGTNFAVEEVSFVAERGELVVLLGESGSGKTTTLKTINRLIEPTSGQVLIDGVEAAGLEPVTLRRAIGYVFQGIGLFPHMTIAQNVAVVPNLLGWSNQDIASRVDELLELVNLPPDEFRNRLPRGITGIRRTAGQHYQGKQQNRHHWQSVHKSESSGSKKR